MTASVRLSEPELDEIRRTPQTQEELEPTFNVEVGDAEGKAVAEVQEGAAHQAKVAVAVRYVKLQSFIDEIVLICPTCSFRKNT
jgi:hypothetical protein